MKEPNKIPLDPSTPTHKNVNKIPMPSVYKQEWDIAINDNDELFSPKDLDKINETLDKISNENNNENNS